MIKRSYKLFLNDILNSIDKIEKYIDHMSYDDFVENQLVQDAIIRNLEVMGEAANNIPENVKEKHPDIPWRRMIGLRNIMIHAYFGIDLPNIWRIITRNIPEVKNDLLKVRDNI